jgi:hypothetical protein
MEYHWNTVRGLFLVFWYFLFCASAGFAGTIDGLYTPLEQNDYKRLTGTEERSEYLKKLSPHPSDKISVQYRILGKTINQLPIEALLIKFSEYENHKKPQKLRIMLMAAQHGSEISGCEALLLITGNWVSGRDRPEWMKHIEFLIIPAVNPDGIQNKKRVNAQGVNLSTDYGVLAAPESTVVNTALMEFKPHVVLDIHESALLKKKSLGAEGWLTDFEAQFEYANNPNIDEELQQFSADVMLPQILMAVREKGLRADRYIGERYQKDLPVIWLKPIDFIRKLILLPHGLINRKFRILSVEALPIHHVF